MVYSVYRDSRVKLLIYLKVSQLNREAMSSIKYNHIADYLKIYKWSKSQPFSFHEATNDIVTITAEEIVAFLARRSANRADHFHEDSFKDMFK